MRITIIAVGSMPVWTRAVIGDYMRRLQQWSVIVQEVNVRGKWNAQMTVRKETEAIVKAIPPDSYKVLLGVDGRRLSSRLFAAELNKRSAGHVCFIIGGAYGVDKKAKIGDDVWSLSDLTFTHVFARLLLLEQLYRAHCIHINHPYHK